MFDIVNSEFVVPVPPAYLGGKEMLAAEEALDSLILMNDDRMGGVLIAYENLRFGSHGLGQVQDEQPDVLFSFKAKLLIYAPSKGNVFKATVTEIQAGHVTLLTAGVFPVIVRSSEYPENVIVSGEPRQMVHAKKRSNVLLNVGDEKPLKCVRVIRDNNVLTVEATFVDLV